MKAEGEVKGEEKGGSIDATPVRGAESLRPPSLGVHNCESGQAKCGSCIYGHSSTDRVSISTFCFVYIDAWNYATHFFNNHCQLSKAEAMRGRMSTSDT
jgi:hypothetical protein